MRRARAAAAAGGGAADAVTSVTLTRLTDIPVYHVASPRGVHLVDARTGQLLRITRETAERLARLQFALQGPAREVTVVTRHSVTYPWGPVPVYRIVFESDPATTYHVSMTDGTVQRSNRWGWLHGAIASAHTFEPMKLVTGSDFVRKGFLVLFSVIGISAALTGYYLVFRG